MITERDGEYWTKVKRLVHVDNDQFGELVVKETSCCCKAPGESRRECMTAAGNKTPCRCHCHSKKL